MRPVLTGFADSPDRGRGLARDFRVRWACAETGLAYDTRSVRLAALRDPEHRARSPFSQIPAWEEDGLILFESGAILLHIAEGHSGLLPVDRAARARDRLDLCRHRHGRAADLRSGHRRHPRARAPWHADRRPMLVARVHRRLRDLAEHLGGRDWLDGAFTAGDLMMVTVLRRLQGSEILGEHPALGAYMARAEARPAFVQALAEQMAAWNAGKDAGP
ncbi:MAG: glutathione S-transferase family protein [Tabrizicola sp.]